MQYNQEGSLIYNVSLRRKESNDIYSICLFRVQRNY
jgi:hypothetical protein